MHFPGSQWDQNIKAEVVGAIFKAALEGPDALMEIYACHEKAISVPDSGVSSHMDDCDGLDSGQKVEPTINQVVTWIENKKLELWKLVRRCPRS